MKEHEMVEVILFDNGTYEVTDIDKTYTTQRLDGARNGEFVKIYHCPKEKWKNYLLELLSDNNIDERIAELEKNKKNLKKLENKIRLELKQEKQTDDEIKVGDEVIFSKEWYKTKAVITNIDRESNTAVCLCADGDDCVFVSPSILTKTGSHFTQIAEVLKQMKGERVE